MPSADASPRLIAFTFRNERHELEGHGLAVVMTPEGVIAYDPNEGAFLIPAQGWAGWVEKHLISAYGKIEALNAYPVRLKTVKEQGW